MLNIMKNVCRLLLRRKGFLFVGIILPIVLTLALTSMYSNSKNYVVGIVNKDKGVLGEEISSGLDELKSVKVNKLEDREDNVNKLIFNEIYMLVTIEEDFTENLLKGEKGNIKFNATNKDEMVEVVKNIMNMEAKSLSNILNNVDTKKVDLEKVIKKYRESIKTYDLVNKEEESRVNILATIGLILYIIFISGGMASSLILEDETLETKNRILMGKVSEKTYYASMIIIFFILSSIPAMEYYITCKMLNYDIGFKEEWILVVLLLLMVLLAVTFSILLSTLVKNKAIYGVVSATLTVPIFMLSGAYWEFSMMGEGLQKVGSIFPIRWFMAAIEKLQQGAGLSGVMPNIIGLILIIVLMFLLSIFFTKNKIVLTREK